MRKKYKMTGCARFFIVMLILAPLAYIGASYYQGQDGIENIKNLLGINAADSGSSDTYDGTSRDIQRQLDRSEKRVEELIRENDDLKDEIDKLEKEIRHLKQMSESQ